MSIKSAFARRSVVIPTAVGVAAFVAGVIVAPSGDVTASPEYTALEDRVAQLDGDLTSAQAALADEREAAADLAADIEAVDELRAEISALEGAAADAEAQDAAIDALEAQLDDAAVWEGRAGDLELQVAALEEDLEQALQRADEAEAAAVVTQATTKESATASSGTDQRYPYCKDLPSGYGPYVKGVDPEYDWYRDNDGDGVVCE
ncbi:excalibur calcium-binding domain-containing protein [Demequina sp. NBRC 110055]|uniref:excalibur calcium-binding domain-containing protein n=1 Tax=Demequina sp. NBRC 110055 TaxID=1570344 RepID=UPI0011861F62|nr:excalibur calcium-binding domain-containing protein [Demequina sp. NBRC 110055]